MNLHELEIKKAIQATDSRAFMFGHTRYGNLRYILKNHGFSILGYGIEGLVAQHPTKPYALKIFIKSSRYKKFVDFSKKNINNPHVPKFSRYVADIPGTNFSYVRMELLESCNKNELIENYINSILYLWIACVKNTGSNGLGSLSNALLAKIGEITDEKCWLPNDYDNEDIMKEIWKIVGLPDQSWMTAVDNLFLFGIRNQIREYDLHSGNIMKRGNTLVITDPWI